MVRYEDMVEGREYVYENIIYRKINGVVHYKSTLFSEWRIATCVVHVEIMFNGAMREYKFAGTLKDFETKWDNHICATGYFTGNDVHGQIVIINPAQSGTISMKEVKEEKRRNSNG